MDKQPVSQLEKVLKQHLVRFFFRDPMRHQKRRPGRHTMRQPERQSHR